MCTVVNFKQYGSVAALNRVFGDRWLYIGRGNRAARLDASPLANPYRPYDFGGKRGATLPHYRRWLWRQIQAGNQDVLQALAAVTDESVLVCYCAPGPCHGEAVRGAAAWLRERA
jgi:hypothetical protein